MLVQLLGLLDQLAGVHALDVQRLDALGQDGAFLLLQLFLRLLQLLLAHHTVQLQQQQRVTPPERARGGRRERERERGRVEMKEEKEEVAGRGGERRGEREREKQRKKRLLLTTDCNVFYLYI